MIKPPQNCPLPQDHGIVPTLYKHLRTHANTHARTQARTYLRTQTLTHTGMQPHLDGKIDVSVDFLPRKIRPAESLEMNAEDGRGAAQLKRKKRINKY